MSGLAGPLDRKLGRDLWRMKGQVTAIALVIGLGVMMLVMMDGVVNSLTETKQAYYERYRLADIFAPVKRAPVSLLDRLARLPGVAAVTGRLNGDVLIDLPKLDVPVRALAISLPGDGESGLNAIYLMAGRRPDPGRGSEIVLLTDFARAHDLGPGDRLAVTLNGTRRTLDIVGLARSPEFLYAAPPGEPLPNDARFAVIWMGQDALAAALDQQGAMNEVLIRHERRGAPAGGELDDRAANSLSAVLANVDRLLEPWGGTGAFPLADHVSDRYITEDMKGMESTSRVLPPIFLAIAAFLLNIVITRMIEAEREQIGLLKAFGYTGREVSSHYFRFVLIIALTGAVLGCIAGIAAGRAMIDVYLVYFKFPFLVFQVDPAAFLIGIGVSVIAAAAGGGLVLRRVFTLQAAVAMRPPPPVDYSRLSRMGGMLGSLSGILGARLLHPPSRMVVRRIARQPFRTALAVLGVAVGMALSVGALGVMSGFNQAVSDAFTVLDRSDVTIVFATPVTGRVAHDLMHQPGVQRVEPFRVVPVKFRHGTRTYRGAINGFVDTPELNRPLRADGRSLYPRRDGLILSVALARRLGLKPGDRVQADVREGRRPRLTLPVVAIAEVPIGAPAYMELSALNRAMRQPDRVGGAYLAVDTDQQARLYRRLKDMPVVTGVSVKQDARTGFKKLMDQGAGAVRYIMTAIAAIITFGIVYNTARIAFAERSRDLASLRVIGFTRAEAAFVLLGELGVVVLLALPIGALGGQGLAQLMATGFSTDLYQIPATVQPENYGLAMVAVLVAALVSGALIKRDLDGIELVSALKTRE